MKKLFGFLICAMLVLSLPITVMAADQGAGNSIVQHNVINLMESGWSAVNGDGTTQQISQDGASGEMILSPNSSFVVCTKDLHLDTASRCTFDLVCSSKSPYGGKVTDLRLFEGDTAGAASNYIGPFYRANGDLVGQLIKTFNSGTHYFGIRNDSSDDIMITGLNVSFDSVQRNDASSIIAPGETTAAKTVPGTTEKMDPMKEAKAAGLVLKDVRDSHVKPHTIGMVGKETISDVEFRIRYAKAVGNGSSDPYGEAVTHLTKLKNELAFVKEKNIETTSREVAEYTNEQRRLYQNSVTQEQKDWMTQYIEALGLTQDEYWGKYGDFNNTRYLNHINAIEYAKKHNLKSIPLSNDEFRVTDQDFTKTNFHEKVLDGVKF